MPVSTRSSQRSVVDSLASNNRNSKSKMTTNITNPAASESNQDKSYCEALLSEDADLMSVPISEIIDSILEIASDPRIERLALALKTRLPQGVADAVEAEKRGRSIVISGIPECGLDQPLSVRQKDLEQKVVSILDTMKVDCVPEVTYRLGKFENSKPRLVKVVLPSKTHWTTALRNARLLRRSEFSNVFVRMSMTKAERARDYDLRQQARERNRGKAVREWFVYKGELKHMSDLPRNSNQGNL
ncbi:hypothetical protein Y032_0086g1901 [Ancylostoma ceylanicum]|uniref:Uncharacterized protein n=1 Tax=Ancylostoma ceylanicum TaxID=53326 RepID=A0A016TPT8_9BILA|nr:hypothetical protein Y032_0086g1901 [Ancylostoma ceylanicum]